MPKDKVDWINVINSTRPQYIDPGEIGVTGRVVSKRIFLYTSAPTANNDGFDTAGIGLPFYEGDEWRDVGSTPQFTYSCDDNSQGAAVWNLFGVPAIFGGIYVAGASTAQAITTGATYTKVTAFTNNDLAKNVTPDAANDKITVTVDGIYQVILSNSLASGTPNINFFGSVFLDGAEQDQCHWTRKVGSAGDIGASTLSGKISVTAAPMDLDFRVRHDDGSDVNLTISYANLSVNFIGKS